MCLSSSSFFSKREQRSWSVVVDVGNNNFFRSFPHRTVSKTVVGRGPWFHFRLRNLRDYDIEIEGLKRETLKAQEEHEGLVAIRDRLESSRAFVEEQLAKTKVRDLHRCVKNASLHV